MYNAMYKNESKIAAAIREEYTEKQTTKLSELVELDRKVKRPAEIFAYSFGTVGALVLGTGMCLAMEVIGSMMPLGIVVGVVGIAMVTANYFIYKAMVKKGKKKYGRRILELSNEILHE